MGCNAKVCAVTKSHLQFATIKKFLRFVCVCGNYETLLITFRKRDNSGIKVLSTLFVLESLNKLVSKLQIAHCVQPILNGKNPPSSSI